MYSKEERPSEPNGKKDLLFHDTPVFAREAYAGFWLRFAAYLIDGIVVFVAIFLVSMVGGLGTFFQPNIEDVGAGFYGMMGLLYIAAFLYFPVLESSKWQATVGKRAVGIIVTDLDGRRIGFAKALGRTLAKILSGIIIYIGYLMVAFTERKQGLHDILAGTLVIRGNAA